MRGEDTHAGGHWVTHQGRHIFIQDGGPPKQVILPSSNAPRPPGSPRGKPFPAPPEFVQRHQRAADASFLAQQVHGTPTTMREPSKFDPRKAGIKKIGM